MLKQDSDPTTGGVADASKTGDIDQLGADGLWNEFPPDTPGIPSGLCTTESNDGPAPSPLPPRVETQSSCDVMYMGLEEAMPNPDVVDELCVTRSTHVSSYADAPPAHRSTLTRSIPRCQYCIVHALWYP